MDILFLDIETVSCKKSYYDLDERLQKCWDKKASALGFKDLEVSNSFYDRAGVYAEFGKIICIGIGFIITDKDGATTLRVKCLYGDDEKKVLLDFKNILDNNPNISRLCAHNGKEFDFPYISRRMIVNGITLPSILNISNKKPWEVNHLDTMELWKFGDRKQYTSLELLAAIFDIPSSKDNIDGASVNKYYYENKDLASIANYCLKDVVVTTQLFLRLNQMQYIDNDNIVFL